MIKFQLFKGNLASMNHGLFDSREFAQQEANRINNLIIARNKQIDENPAIGHGSSFLNVKDEANFSVREIEI